MLALLLVLQQSIADSSSFRALALPPATSTRSASGAPGPRYWQQRADYTLQATLDTGTNVLRGQGRIYYVNRSPETLDHVWVQLDQNLFAPNSISRALNLPPLRFAGGVVFDFTSKGFAGGITVDRFAVAGRPLTTKVFGTMMRVELARPLAPNLSITFDIAWHFPIPPYGRGRSRRRGKSSRLSRVRKRSPARPDPFPARARGALRRVACATSPGPPDRDCAGMQASGMGFWCRRSTIPKPRPGKNPT